jgi:antagonist of KipI
VSLHGAIEVVETGLLTTVQDAGRWGWQHLGVPVGGAMDVRALAAANRVVGNGRSHAALEMTIVGPTLVLTPPLVIALAGAAHDAHLEGQLLQSGRPVEVTRPSLLRIGPLRDGARLYLAVRGGLAVPRVLGSCSTTPGILGGRPVRAGDRFEPDHPVHANEPVKIEPTEAMHTRPAGPCILRVLPGPDASGTQVRAFEELCASPYVLRSESNRMGYRLRGASIACEAHHRLSSGTVTGAVQIPPDGQPILLMADRQTTGGYPVVAVLITADVSRAAQLTPGDDCRFVPCTRQHALAALLRREQRLPIDDGYPW